MIDNGLLLISLVLAVSLIFTLRQLIIERSRAFQHIVYEDNIYYIERIGAEEGAIYLVYNRKTGARLGNDLKWGHYPETEMKHFKSRKEALNFIGESKE